MLRLLRRVRVSTWVLLAIFAGTLWLYLLVRPASPAASDSPLGTQPAHTSSPTPTPTVSPRPSPTPSPTPRATQPSPTPRIRSTPSPTVGATPSPTTAGSPDPTSTDPAPAG